jgi:hypothetical protein
MAVTVKDLIEMLQKFCDISEEYKSMEVLLAVDNIQTHPIRFIGAYAAPEGNIIILSSLTTDEVRDA